MECLRVLHRRSIRHYRSGCRLYRALSRFESTAASEDLSGAEHEVDDEAQIPLVPRRRDPHAVLKALSSTLSPLPHPLLMGGRSLADPMVPRTRTMQLEYQRAHEAGRKAAQYVINRWPKMFPDIEPEPDLRPTKVKPQGLNEDTLKDLITRRQTGRALKMFWKLQEKGDPVSMDTQNSLLELLAYHGLGNLKKDGKSALFLEVAALSSPEEEGSVNREVGEEGEEVLGMEGSAVEEAEEGEGRMLKEMEEGEILEEVVVEGEVMGREGGEVREGKVEGGEVGKGSKETIHFAEEDLWVKSELEGAKEAEATLKAEKELDAKERAHLMLFNSDAGGMWSVKNQAEKLFEEMPETNGGTYDALILGLVKFREYDRAWKMFERMRKEGQQASTATYNSLLFIIGSTYSPHPWDDAKALLQHMTQEPVVRPDITTVNLLLEICSRTGSASSMQLSLKTIREALHLGLEPNLATFLALLRAHLKSSDGSILYDITDYLEKNQHIMKIADPQDIFFFPAAMTAARLMLDHKLAIRLRRLGDRDNWMLCQNLIFFISQYLTTISGRVPIETLRKEYKIFVPWVILPMERVYGIMFRACEEQGSPEFALEMWNDIMKYHIKISSVVTLTRLCGAITKKVYPSEADSVLKTLMQVWDMTLQSNFKPSAFMISQIVRMHCMRLDMEQAWQFYTQFEHYGIQPTFMALISLVKGYSGVPDTDKMVQMLKVMLKQRMVVPTTFVRDICWKTGVDEDTRAQLVAGFARKEGAQSSQGELDSPLL